jgi:hypothetical protein
VLSLIPYDVRTLQGSYQCEANIYTLNEIMSSTSDEVFFVQVCVLFP